MSTFYVYAEQTLEYLGEVEAADRETAGQFARALWARPLKLLTWRLHLSEQVAA